MAADVDLIHDDDDGPTRGEAKVMLRAVEEEWPIPASEREKTVRDFCKIRSNIGGKFPVRDRIRAGLALAKLNQQNIEVRLAATPANGPMLPPQPERKMIQGTPVQVRQLAVFCEAAGIEEEKPNVQKTDG